MIEHDLAYKIGSVNLNMRNEDFTVMNSNDVFKQKRYTDWIQDWSNWFYQSYPDRNNDGDVVFLRSTPLSPANYQNEAHVMIGNESLEITDNQRVLLPVITATFIADQGESPEWMYGMARGNISKGDNPPKGSQLKINGKGIHEYVASNKTQNEDVTNLKFFSDYEFETPVYQIHIPDAPPGVTLKYNVEYPIESSGYFPAVTRGYFIILELHSDGPSKGDFYIHCEATGETTPSGPYTVSFFYHVKVRASQSSGPESMPLPERLTRNIAVKVREKLDKGQITGPEITVIKKHLGENWFETEVTDTKKLVERTTQLVSELRKARTSQKVK